MNVYKVSRVNPQFGESAAPTIHIELEAFDAETLYRSLMQYRDIIRLQNKCYIADQVADLADDLCIVLNDSEIHAERMRQTLEIDSEFEEENPPKLPEWYIRQKAGLKPL
jgi:hypothetical protein